MENNPDIVVCEFRHGYILRVTPTPEYIGYHSYHIAPKTGLYDVDKLQEFMEGITRLFEFDVIRFRQHEDKLYFGRLFSEHEASYEDASIDFRGLIRRQMFRKSPNKLDRKSLLGSMKKKTSVIVYPNSLVAEAVFNVHVNESWVSLEDLDQYKAEYTKLITASTQTPRASA